MKKIIDTSPADLGKLRAMVESGNIGWSVTEVSGEDASRAVDPRLMNL